MADELQMARWEVDWWKRRYEHVVRQLPMPALIAEHDEMTMICSFQHHARKVSGPVYEEIMRRAESGTQVGGRPRRWNRFVVSDVLNYLRHKGGGMHVMMLLWDITDEDPTRDHQEGVGDTGFVGFNVEGCRQAWLSWGERMGLI